MAVYEQTSSVITHCSPQQKRVRDLQMQVFQNSASETFLYNKMQTQGGSAAHEIEPSRCSHAALWQKAPTDNLLSADRESWTVQTAQRLPWTLRGREGGSKLWGRSQESLHKLLLHPVKTIRVHVFK